MTLVIGIAGASGSGKTYLAGRISKKFNGSSVINQDSYYLPQPNIPKNDRSKLNFDVPSMIDWVLLRSHLLSVKKNKSISVPVYSFKHHSRLRKTKKLNPGRLVIVEGIFVFNEFIRDIFDFKIFLDPDPKLCLRRRLKRDIQERGRTKKYSLNQYYSTTLPGYRKYIQPTKRHADIILKNRNISNLLSELASLLGKDSL